MERSVQLAVVRSTIFNEWFPLCKKQITFPYYQFDMFVTLFLTFTKRLSERAAANAPLVADAYDTINCLHNKKN